MVKNSLARHALLSSAALLLPLSAMAQQVAEPLELNPVILKSKRVVAVHTATPETTIGQEEIDDRQASTIAELADSIPGVTLMNGSTPGGSGINIRGFGATGTYGSDQMVLIQVDGATQGSEELYRLGTQLYTDPALYKQLKVTRGTVGSFEYGSGVVGGMVQLTTKDASDFTGGVPGFKLRQTLEFTSNGAGRTSSTIMAWQPTEDLEFMAQYVWRSQDEQVDGDGEDTGAEPFKLPSYFVKGKYTFGEARDQSITFSYNDSQIAESDVPYDQFGLGGGLFGNVDRDIHTRTMVLAYEYDPDSPWIKIEANLSYADQRIDSTYIEGSSPNNQGRSLGNADHRYETTKLTVKNTSEFATGDFQHDLRYGFEIIHKERAEASSAPGGTDQRYALFVVDTITTGAWTFSPAIRYENQKLEREDGVTSTSATEYDNDAVMGGFSARYAWDNGISVFGSIAYTENLPILDDFNTVAYMTRAQKARVYELGGGYDGADILSAGDALAVKVNIYQNDVWDVTSYSGVTDVETKGIEIEASYSHQSGFYVDMNAQITEGDQTLSTGVENYWTNAPADRLRTVVGKRFDETLDLSWELVANARMDRVNSGTDEAAGSVIHNLRASYRPQSGVFEGTELRLGIENLFDTDYKPWLATRDAPGRNVKLTVSKTF
jgi:hemoglobin/transferrin/lactoferrin receptor protein